jgi:TolB-like protein/lipoprotein NlpI
MAESSSEGTAGGTTPTTFISYASQDAAVAAALVEALEQRGIACWMAPRDVRAGALYADAIVRAISSAGTFVLVLSANAIASSHVGKEIERASSKKRRIIALRMDAAPLTPALEYFLSESQWVEARADSMEAAYFKLLHALADSGRVGTDIHPALGAGASAGTAPGLRANPRLKMSLLAAAMAVVAIGCAALLLFKAWPARLRSAEQPAVPESSVSSETSVAVLPFTDMSEGKDQEYFADGMAEELGDLLAKIPGLKVIGRTSAFQFKGRSEDLRAIGAKLGAAYVVEGSVRKAGQRIRVTAQLIDSGSGTNRWTQTYDRDFGDVLRLQDEIATGIARAMQLAVDADGSKPAHRLQSTEAYTLYLRGRASQDQLHLSQLLEAAQDYKQALALDPTFVRAAEALALTYVAQGYDEDVLSSDAWRNAREAARQALRMDPKSAAAHGVLGLVHALEEFDWEAADAEFRTGLALNPRDSITLGYAAIVAQSRGQFPEAQRLYSAALAVDPISPLTLYNCGDLAYKTGDLDVAELHFRKALAANPMTDGGHYMLGRILLRRGDAEAALKEFQADVALDAKDAGLAMAYHALRRTGDSNAALERLVRESGETWPYVVAVVHAYRGERDEAFRWLDKALVSRDSDFVASVRADPELAPLRSDHRYPALLKRMNLPN